MFGECHGHIFMDGVDFQEARKLHADGVIESDVRKKLAEYQNAGITFFRDGGDAYGVSEYAASCAGEYGIDYRTPVYAIHKNKRYGSIVGKGFDDMKQYHQLVLGVREKGGDFIKVMFSGIMDFAHGGSVTGTPLTKDEIREMIHIAHEEGFRVMAHVNGARTIQQAAEAGVDSVEHGNFMDDECLHALKESNAVWVPTYVTIHNLLESDRYPTETITSLAEQAKDNIRKGFRMGIPIAAGSDAGAYRVPHVTGTEDEVRQLRLIYGNKEEADKALQLGEKQIRERFRRG